ncbi:MAG: hypothetical protein HY318_00205 [Armatimonadetes bacterium]|nr:hypothetical protein [Armatimonadota bacterium]
MIDAKHRWCDNARTKTRHWAVKKGTVVMLTPQQLQIERTPSGTIVVSSNGKVREVSSLRAALSLIETHLTLSRPRRHAARHGELDPIQTLCGKYRDALTPTDQWIVEHREEVALEERKLARSAP